MIRSFSLFIVLFLAQTALAQVAGQPLELKKLADYTVEDIERFKKQLGIRTPTTSSVTVYKLRYYTANLEGQVVVASAGVAVPNDQPIQSRPILSYQHGTTTRRDHVPSSGQTELIINGAFYASNGYLVVAADYLGLGDEMSFHPYLHADSQASACADALLALYELNLTESKKLFLAGYSQGGHATMALHRYWQAKYSDQHPITAAAPMAGPYYLSETVVETSKDMAKISAGSVTYTGYLLLAMNLVYNLDAGLTNYVQAPYAARLPELFDGTHNFSEIAAFLPKTLPAFLQPDFIGSIKNTPGQNAFIAALEKNDVYDWKPLAPVQFCHGDADLDVPYVNTTKVIAYLTSLGATVTEAVIPSGLNHGTAAMPCFRETHKFFETLR